ncbi:MAG: response regulator, partial [Myxococcales bacterium]|nr:response regulator [Myxococcales bacterium]
HDLQRIGGGLWAGGRRLLASDGRDVGVPDVLDLASEPTGRTWVLAGEGLWTIPGGGEPQLVREHDIGLGSVLVDHRGRLWLGTPGGLELFAPFDGEQLQTLGRWQGLGGVRRLLEDREGNIWAGTDREGLVRVTEMPFERHFAGIPTQLLQPWRDTVLAAVGCGRLVDLDGTPVAGDRCDADATHLDPDGTLWVAHDRELAPLGRPDEGIELPARVLAVARRDDELWIGTEGAGAWVLDGRGLRQVDQLNDLVVDVIAVGPDDAVWLGLLDGVAIAAGDGIRVLRAAEGMPTAQVRSILFHGADVWLGTYGGGLVLTRQQAVVTIIGRGRGMVEDIASALLDDGEGHLWVNGNRGVSRISFDDLARAATSSTFEVRARLFPSGEGNGGNTPSATVDDHGRLWFSTIDGAVSFEPAHESVTNPVAPRVRIQELVVDGRPLPIEGAVVPPGRRDVMLRYTASVLSAPHLARFQIRAAPATEWTDVGAERVVRLGNLAPGPIDIDVRAANEDGVWSEPPRASFVLQPSFWERSSTRLLTLAAALATLLATAASLAWRARARNQDLQGEVQHRASLVAGLRRSEQHWRGVFEAATDGLLVLGVEDQVLDANPSACRLFARERDALIGERFGALVDAEAAQAVRPDESRVPVRVSLEDLGDGRRLASLTDLSQLLDLQQRLAQSERLEAIGRLAGGVAHDFNNLLMVVKGSAIELQQDGPADWEEPVDQILEAVERGATLTRHLLAFGQRQVLSPEKIDLGEFLVRTHTVLRRLLRADITVRIDAEPGCVVLADPHQLELVIINLGLHGAQSMPDGGALLMEVGQRDEGVVRAAWGLPERCGAQVVLSVTHGGQALSRQELATVFEPFSPDPVESRARLNIASVHGIVAQSHGHVFVRSEEGRGTTFDVVLPLAETAETPIRPMPTSEPVRGGLRVLVCDDESTVRRALRRLLTTGGYRVVEADCGEDALAMVEAEAPDVLVTDVLMPGMNGFELAKACRKLHPRLPIVFVSGYTREIGTPPMEGPLLQKPFERADLEGAIQRAMTAIGTGPGLRR